MEIIKNINNNYAVAIDGDGNQLIVSGRGIGFGKVPRKITDMSLINRSYYDVDEEYVSMINEFGDNMIELSTRIVDKARLVIDIELGANLVFVLADHINFSIKKLKKGMSFKLPIIHDIEHLYRTEYKIGEYARKLIRDKLNIYLPKEEAAYIALHIIQAEERGEESDQFAMDDKMILDVIQIIEEQMLVKIDRKGLNYSRFFSHMLYLLKRGRSKHLIESDNKELYKMMCVDFPQICHCVDIISLYLRKKINLELTEEEKLYLILHTNRLCSYEDCNQ